MEAYSEHKQTPPKETLNLWNNLSSYNLSFTTVISGFFPFYRHDRSQNGKEITSSQLQIQQQKQQQADSQSEEKSVKKESDLGGMMRDIMDVPFPRADSKALISFLIFHISIFLSVSPPSAIYTTTNTLPLTSFLPPFLASFQHRQFLFHTNSPDTKTIWKRQYQKSKDDSRTYLIFTRLAAAAARTGSRVPGLWFRKQNVRPLLSLSLSLSVSHDSFYHRAASQLGFRRAGSVRVYPGVSGPCS